MYALCRGSDVTVGIIKRGVVTCRTGIIIMMMFVCFWLWVCNTMIARWWVGGTGESFESCDSVTVGRSGTRTARK